MKPTIRSQGGMGAAAFLFLIVLAIVVVTLVIKLGPVYMQYFEIRSIMQNLTEDPGLLKKGRHGVMRSIEDRLYLNYIENVTKNDFKLKKVENGYQLGVKYEVREHLLANLDALMTFSHQVVIKGQ
jgi:hypothetical protein